MALDLNLEMDKMQRWTDSEIELLKDIYPRLGKAAAMAALCKTEPQIRSRASKLGLKARGVSAAWYQKQADHAVKLTGRKRPEQAEVIKELHRRGVLIMTDETKRLLSEAQKAHQAIHGHPRGMLGKKHSQATKDALAVSSAAARARRTDAQQASMADKMVKTKIAKGNLVPERIGASWKAGYREIGGIRKYYRSRWEFNYACYLEWMKQGGFVTSWLHEPDTFWFEGILRGCRSYLPDFKVTLPNGAVEYHEVKGWMDDRSKTKIRRMAKYHPDVTLVVIDAKGYKALEKGKAGIVPGWEL